MKDSLETLAMSKCMGALFLRQNATSNVQPSTANIIAASNLH